MKDTVRIKDWEYLNNKFLGQDIVSNPVIRVIERANELGLKGLKVVEVFSMRFYDPKENCNVEDFTFILHNTTEVTHGNGD